MLPTSLRVLRLAACLLLTLLLASCGLKPASSPVPAAEPGSIQPIAGAQGQKITVGSKNFTEQLILGILGRIPTFCPTVRWGKRPADWIT